ncbi:MAG: hypothetical protein LC667_09860 [Thioalkalivibrio sp.]|nr:hypothetical protein [Thioalkalivibrio sp.]
MAAAVRGDAALEHAWYELLMPYQAWYRLGKGAVGVFADVRTGTVFKLSAYPGYAGKLFDVITPGMLLEQVITADPRFYYDEGQDLVLCEGVGGLELELSQDDPPSHELLHLPVVAITVWDTDLLRSATRRGDHPS